jgi:hypothetical protein
MKRAILAIVISPISLLAAYTDAKGCVTPRIIRYFPDCACNQTRGGSYTYIGDRVTLFFVPIQFKQPPGTKVGVLISSCGGIFPYCPTNGYPVNGGFTAVINSWYPDAPGFTYQSQVDVTVVPAGSRYRK